MVSFPLCAGAHCCKTKVLYTVLVNTSNRSKPQTGNNPCFSVSQIVWDVV